jgi:hypothetical protein
MKQQEKQNRNKQGHNKSPKQRKEHKNIQEPKATRLRIDAATITTKKGEKITAASNEDNDEIENEKMLLEPQVWIQKGWTRTDKTRYE